MADGKRLYEREGPYDEVATELDAILGEAPLTYDPATYEAATLGGSAMEGVRPDEESVEAQQRALRELLGIYREGGITGADRQRLGERLAMERGMTTGAQGAYAADLAERGQGGGASELLASQMGSQGAISRRAAHDRELAAIAQSRALDALMGAGAQGSRLRGQSFDEAAARAGAVDRRNRINADSTTQASRDAADWRNQANLFNAGASERRFGMQSGIAQGRARGLQQDVDRQKAQAQRDREQQQQLFQAGGGVVGAVALGPGGYEVGSGAVGAGMNADDDDEEDE